MRADAFAELCAVMRGVPGGTPGTPGTSSSVRAQKCPLFHGFRPFQVEHDESGKAQFGVGTLVGRGLPGDFDVAERAALEIDPGRVPPAYAQAWAAFRPAEHWTEADEEQAAVIEYDGEAPRGWAEALARLNPSKPPADVPPRRWLTFIDDCGRFIDAGWAEHAVGLGWGPLDLFGCDRDRPFARVDHLGLLWLLNGGKLVELHRDRAVLETAGGAQQTYRRRPIEVGRVVLAWELAGASAGYR